MFINTNIKNVIIITINVYINIYIETTNEIFI